jgi:hypothetical protein
MQVSSKPSLLRIVGEVALGLLLMALGLLSVPLYNYLGVLVVPVGLWVLLRPRSEPALAGAFLASFELTLWYATGLHAVSDWSATDPIVISLVVFGLVASSLMAIGSLRLLRLTARALDAAAGSHRPAAH